MSKHAAAILAPKFANQRVLRTLVQGLIGSIPTIVAIIGIVHDTWPAEWLAVALGVGVAIQGALAKIMALPGVNEFLISVGLGSAPKADAEQYLREVNADEQAKIAREGLL